MTSHELARELLASENYEVMASIDISTGDSDHDRRVFTRECFGVNSFSGDSGRITILFDAEPYDNWGKSI